MITTGLVIFNLFQLVAEKDPTSDSDGGSGTSRCQSKGVANQKEIE